MADKLEVPRRKVRKNWYVGLHPDPVDRSHPDVHDESLVQESSITDSISRKKLNCRYICLLCLSFTLGTFLLIRPYVNLHTFSPNVMSVLLM